MKLKNSNLSQKINALCRGGSRRVAKSLQESILIAFDFIWKVLLSDRIFATLQDPLLTNMKVYQSQDRKKMLSTSISKVVILR